MVDWTRYFSDDNFYSQSDEGRRHGIRQQVFAPPMLCLSLNARAKIRNVLKVDKPRSHRAGQPRSTSPISESSLAKPASTASRSSWITTATLPALPLATVRVLAVQNKDNSLFSLYYVFEMGKNNDAKLPLAVKYLVSRNGQILLRSHHGGEFYQLCLQLQCFE